MDFYDTYEIFKEYSSPELKKKHVRWFDDECWIPADCDTHHRMLEIGCGTGQFLLYLNHKGVNEITGIDLDENLARYVPKEIAAYVRFIEAFEFVEERKNNEDKFDRIFLLDVFEHFPIEGGIELLEKIKQILAADGMVVVRVPNMSSPWGAQHQYSDVTHKAAYTPKSIRQVAIAAGYDCIGFAEQRRGSPVRRFIQDRLHGLLRAVLADQPELWSANFLAYLTPTKN